MISMKPLFNHVIVWTQFLKINYFCAENNEINIFLRETPQEIAATRAALFDSNMHQFVCRLGLRSRPHWGSLQRSPDPLAAFRGPTSRASGHTSTVRCRAMRASGSVENVTAGVVWLTPIGEGTGGVGQRREWEEGEGKRGEARWWGPHDPLAWGPPMS